MLRVPCPLAPPGTGATLLRTAVLLQGEHLQAVDNDDRDQSNAESGHAVRHLSAPVVHPSSQPYAPTRPGSGVPNSVF